MKTDAKKKSHASSELSIIEGYLFGVDSQITVLYSNGEQQPNPAARRERECLLYISIYSIRGHAQVGR